MLDIGEMKDKARSAVLSCRVATVEEAYASILSGSGRFNYYRNRSESLGRGDVVGKTATSLRSADPHLCRVSNRRPRSPTRVLLYRTAPRGRRIRKQAKSNARRSTRSIPSA